MDRSKMAGSGRVAVVTGANKGIGLEIVRQLAEHGLTVVLTARDRKRGEATLDGLHSLGLQYVFFHPLNVRSPESVTILAAWLKEKFGGIDILINNAGYMTGTFGYEEAETTIGTNYRGVKNVVEGLLPVLRASPIGARIVNVTSQIGIYERLSSESLKQVFADEAHYSDEKLEALVARYLADVKAGRAADEGWIPNVLSESPIYSESKMFLNVYAAVLAKTLTESQPANHKIFVASFCPGPVLTEMLQSAIDNGLQLPEGAKPGTVSEGADTGVWLALLPAEEIAPKHGKLFLKRAEYSFGKGP